MNSYRGDGFVCKICNCEQARVVAHTAQCRDCGVLLYWPYPPSDSELIESGKGKSYSTETSRRWYAKSADRNHNNFTEMASIGMLGLPRVTDVNVLDFGGGGGQFACVCRSLFPGSQVYITDISDEALLPEWAPMNRQIPFAEFQSDDTRFDRIFMNDVFEHLSDPVTVLRDLTAKLRPGGSIFVDTPRHFWLYPLTRQLLQGLHRKLLQGTVSLAHLQIWSERSFRMAVANAGLQVRWYRTLSEFTMPPSYYLDNMKVVNPVVRAAGSAFYKTARFTAMNKIQAVLVPTAAAAPDR